MKRAFEEWLVVVGSRKARVSWAIVALITAITGPFGSYADMSLAARLIYWPLVVASAIGLGSAVRVVVARIFGITQFWRAAAAVAVLNVTVFTPLLVWLSPIASRSSVPSMLEFASFVLAGSLGLSAVRRVLGIDPGSEAPVATGVRPTSHIETETASGPPAEAEGGAPACPRLQERLVPEQRGRLIRISGLNHHVEIHTERGVTKLLMRFADAVAETAPVEGIQVHRSHWVALDAVSGVERKAGRVSLKMIDGARVPVSRSHRAALEAAGSAHPILAETA